VGDVILAFNVVLFMVAMYGAGRERGAVLDLTYVAAARRSDFVLYGVDEYTAITIVSKHHERIRERITGDLGRGRDGLQGARRVERRSSTSCIASRPALGEWGKGEGDRGRRSTRTPLRLSQRAQTGARRPAWWKKRRPLPQICC
jgi:hypothetical protein